MEALTTQEKSQWGARDSPLGLEEVDRADTRIAFPKTGLRNEGGLTQDRTSKRPLVTGGAGTVRRKMGVLISVCAACRWAIWQREEAAVE
jgi:hypothetical protein